MGKTTLFADFKLYPAMKASSVPWLREVPTHDEPWRNGQLFAQRDQTEFANLPIDAEQDTADLAGDDEEALP